MEESGGVGWSVKWRGYVGGGTKHPSANKGSWMVCKAEN